MPRLMTDVVTITPRSACEARRAQDDCIPVARRAHHLEIASKPTHEGVPAFLSDLSLILYRRARAPQKSIHIRARAVYVDMYAFLKHAKSRRRAFPRLQRAVFNLLLSALGGSKSYILCLTLPFHRKRETAGVCLAGVRAVKVYARRTRADVPKRRRRRASYHDALSIPAARLPVPAPWAG